MEPGGERWRKAMKMGVKVQITRRPSQENDNIDQQQLQPPADWPKDTIGEMFCARHNLDTEETVYVTQNYAQRSARVDHLEEIHNPSRPNATGTLVTRTSLSHR